MSATRYVWSYRVRSDNVSHKSQKQSNKNPRARPEQPSFELFIRGIQETNKQQTNKQKSNLGYCH